MNDEELKKVLEDPKRILNIARVFHRLLHELDKMDEEKIKQKKGITPTKLKDTCDIVLKDKDGNLKSETKGI